MDSEEVYMSNIESHLDEYTLKSQPEEGIACFQYDAEENVSSTLVGILELWMKRLNSWKNKFVAYLF